MALSRIKTWGAEVLHFTDLNAEFDNLLTPINALTPTGYGTGDLLYASSGSQWAALGAGTNGFVLQMGASIPAWFNLFGTSNTWTANQTISSTAPSLILTDTTASAKSLTVAVDANLAQLRESAGASGSLLALDLTNNYVGVRTAAPLGTFGVDGDISLQLPTNNVDKGIYWGSVGAVSYGRIYRNATSAALWIDAQANAPILLNAGTTGNVGIGMTPTVQFELSGSVGQKASGTTWSNPSDARLKDDVRDYTDGLDAIRKVRPIHYTLNGLAGTPKGTKGISIIAQQMREVMPYTIETYKAKLHPEDTEDTELYRFEASALTFALVNAVKELAAKVEMLESRK